MNNNLPPLVLLKFIYTFFLKDTDKERKYCCTEDGRL